MVLQVPPLLMDMPTLQQKFQQVKKKLTSQEDQEMLSLKKKRMANAMKMTLESTHPDLKQEKPLIKHMETQYEEFQQPLFVNALRIRSRVTRPSTLVRTRSRKKGRI